MKATQLLHNLGQSIWLDNITRDLMTTGTLEQYIQDLSVTGLTSNPTIFEHAIKNSKSYDAAILKKLEEGKSDEVLFFELALDDLTKAADLFRPIYNRTNGVDGWVSLEVSPLLAHDTGKTLAAAIELHAHAARPNLFIKIPGTKEGLPAIEEAIFKGVPINVTLLFSREHYLAAAETFLRGIERRMDAGLNPNVDSVASLFISRWDAAITARVPEAMRNKLGIAIAMRTYKAARGLLGSPRWQRIYNAGARPQRLLWASTGTKDPAASDVLSGNHDQLIRAYAVHRPDGLWALLLINRDPTRTFQTNMIFRNTVSGSVGRFDGPLDLYQFSSRQYALGGPPDGPFPVKSDEPEHQLIQSSTGTLSLPPYSLTVIRGALSRE
jgi:transaldolase